jgi:hypothetical protein
MNRLEEVDRFYAEHVPAQFNHTLDRQQRAAARDPEEARLLDEMRAVRTSIVVRIDADEEQRSHCFDIERGRMQHVTAPQRPPFLVLHHALDQFDSLRRGCGDSMLGFLGALAGLGEEMRLTAQRVRSLKELAGGVRFETTGEAGFALVAHFGDAAAESEPRTGIRIRDEIFARLRSGSLDPQAAFLDGLIEIEGDEELAIRLALAASSPE